MARIKKAFQELILTIPVANIVLQREITDIQRNSLFYRQIAASIDEIGLIEPLVVFPRPQGEFLLLDGHMRLEVFKQKGTSHVSCILSKDDESYTYNRRVNSIPPVIQHLMLLKALNNGLTEERIAASLQVNIAVIRQKRDMLNGICKEAVEILQTRKVSTSAFGILRKMKPLRQVEASEHMVASSTYSASFVKALLYATKSDLLVDPPKVRNNLGLAEATRAQFTQESDSILRDLKNLEAELGQEVLTLTVFQGYVSRLVKNPRVHRYLERKHREILEVLQSATAETPNLDSV